MSGFRGDAYKIFAFLEFYAVEIVYYQRLETTTGPFLKRAWIYSPETSVANYQSGLRKIPEQ